MDTKLENVREKLEKGSKLLLSKSCQEIVSYFNEILECDDITTNNLNLIEALLVNVSEHEQLLEIYEHIVDFLWLKDVDTLVRPIISIFLSDNLDSLEDWKVERLCFRMIQKLNSACLDPLLLFDILAKALLRLENSDSVLSSMIDSLCSVEWCNENVVCLLDVLRNYGLQRKSMEKILEKSLPKIISWEVDKLQAFVQSILLFAFPIYMEFLFRRLLPLIYGNNSSNRSCEVIRGQLMMQIFSLVEKDENFGRVIFETVKSLSKSQIEPEFYYTVLMTLLPIQSTQTQAIQLLTISILTAFSDSHLISESSFLRGLCQLSEDPKEIILKLSERCTSSQWEFTVHGMVLLGFTLLRAACSSTASSSNIFGAKVTGRLSKPLSTSPFLTHDTLKLRIIRSGLDLLVHLFKHCHCSRDEIITMTANLIWSESNASIALYALDLLSDLVAICPLEVAVRANCLDPIIDSIGLLPLSISTALVHALLPLIRAGSLLELENISENDKSDSNPFTQVRMRLITNLCKAANSPRIPSRCTAVSCFTLLLKHLKVSVSTFRSASQYSSSSSSLSQPFVYSQSQATQRNPLVLFSQLQSTQIAQQAVFLPCDIVQNEVLCTEIISILHRIIFFAFFRSQSGSLLTDPENVVKSNIYWGLCEVVTRNRGLCEAVLNLYLRLLIGCLAPNFLKTLKRSGTQNSLTLLTPINPLHTNFIPTPPFLLNKLIESNITDGEIKRSEHPDILIWCLQLILTLPIFNPFWRRLRLQGTSNSASESSEISSSSSAGISQFTQSTLDNSIQCGRLVTYSLFSKAVNLLISISNSLRLLPKEDFGLTTETDFGATSGGKLNRDRVQLLINIYDACLEFELKDPLASDLLHAGNFQSQFPNQTSPESTWLRIRSDSRSGLLIMSLISISQANLKSILIASIKSDSVNPLACHILQTLSTRLNQFTHCTEGDIPCAYRDALVVELVPVMKCVIRFYHHKIMSDEAPTTGTTVAATATATSEDDASNQADQSKPRSTTTISTSSTALQVFNIGLTLTLHYLGTQRLHKICRILYPVTNNPNYSEQLFNSDSDIVCDSEGVEDDDESSESLVSGITPAQGLSSLISLVKSWVSRLLNPSGANSTTQKLTQHNFPYAKDLVILLPLLVKLCRARASIGSEVTNPEVNKFNPYSGLSRVLAWLLRLMRSPISSRYISALPSLSQANSTNAIATAARVQLINQAIWLAHLVGANSSGRISQASDAELSLDDIILGLASDLTAVLGNVADSKDISFMPDAKEAAITYPLVTRSSALSILPLIYASIKQTINEYDWLLNHISKDYAGRLDVKDKTASKDIGTKLEGNEQEEALCLRLIGLGEILAQLLQTALPAPSSHVDTLLEIGVSVFNLLGRLTKYYLHIIGLHCGRFPVIFERVVRVYGREVAPRAYTLFSYIQNSESEKVKGFQESKGLKKKLNDKDQCESKKQTSASGMPQALISRTIKDSRLIPQLIYAIEQYERFLMQLSKKSKINLMRNVKLSTSRDFRINQATLVAHLEQSAALSVSSLSESNTTDEEEEEDNLSNEIVNFINPTDNTTDRGDDQAHPPLSVSEEQCVRDVHSDADENNIHDETHISRQVYDTGNVDENSENVPSVALSESRTETPVWGRVS
ncbi:unnamed protein product [Heterobilharzia americana]|nr:unnamed protein product [Heterobilharzia americana]